MFLNNAWYVAELSARVQGNLASVRMLGQPVLLYRTEAGDVVALEDACPHRKLPLSMGRRRGDHIECGYHGMTFDRAGLCVRVPGTQPIPSTARVRSYPVAERYGFIWVWMGEPALADAGTIFRIEHWDDPAWGRTVPDMMTVHCNYLYITDNLLDPTHVAWVHPDSFGDAACAQTPLQTVMSPDGVAVSRWMLATEVAPFYSRFVKFSGRADRKQHYEVRFPSHALIRAIFAPADTGGPQDRLHPDTFLMDSYNFLTPADDRTTRYFWLQTRNFAPDDSAVSRVFAQSVRGAFEEDKVVLEAVQLGMEQALTPHLDLVIDGGPSRFRRRLKQLVQAERGAPVDARD